MVKVTIKGNTDKMLAKRFYDMMNEDEGIWLKKYRTPFYWFNTMSSSMFLCWMLSMWLFSYAFIIYGFSLYGKGAFAPVLLTGVALGVTISSGMMTRMYWPERHRFMKSLDKLEGMTPNQYKEYVQEYPEDADYRYMQTLVFLDKIQILKECDSVSECKTDLFGPVIIYTAIDKTKQEMHFFYPEIHRIEKAEAVEPELLLDIAEDGSFMFSYIEPRQEK